MRDVYLKCRAELSDLELWPHYYATRYRELRSILSHWPSPPGATVLEVGCGIGYVSALLAQTVGEVYATDVAGEDPTLHAVGIERADAFLERLAVPGVTTRPVDAENMPFDDDTFDVVLSMFVIQHIPGRTRAAAEMARVLKPGGFAVHLVPNRMTLVYGFVRYWVYLARRGVAHALRLARRLVRRLARRFARRRRRGSGGGRDRDEGSVGTDDRGGGTDERGVADTIRSSGQFGNFPLPPVFGMYGSSREEWVESGRGQWLRLLSAGGRLRPVKAVTITLNPLPILGANYLIILRKPDIE